MKCATAMLETSKTELAWLGQKGDLGLPKFLPDLPKPQQDRIDVVVERELARFLARAERQSRARASKKARTTA